MDSRDTPTVLRSVPKVPRWFRARGRVFGRPLWRSGVVPPRRAVPARPCVSGPRSSSGGFVSPSPLSVRARTWVTRRWASSEGLSGCRGKGCEEDPISLRSIPASGLRGKEMRAAAQGRGQPRPAPPRPEADRTGEGARGRVEAGKG